MDTRTGDARHICRKCGQIVPPQRGAHVKMVNHAIRCGIRLVYECTADCGFRATPAEGRYK